MNISKISNNSPNFGCINGAKILSKAANINSWQQRAILGVTAMTMQPVINLMNKDIDEKTRKTSMCADIAQGGVCMATGILVRGGCMKAVEQGLKNDNFAQKVANITQKSKDFIKSEVGRKQYSGVIGTIAAIGVMMFTNFLVDAPLTNMATNALNKHFANKEDNTTGGGQN